MVRICGSSATRCFGRCSGLAAQRAKKSPGDGDSRGQIKLQGILAQVVWHDIICSVTSNDISCSLPRTVTNYLEALSTF